jgi:hypothetical protein
MPGKKKWITPGEIIAMALGGLIGWAIDAAIQFAFVPRYYVGLFGLLGAILGIAVFTAIKSRNVDR